MVMTDSAGSAAEDVHSRMPVLLAPGDYTAWVSGTPDKALSLCRAWRGDITIDRTQQPWARGASEQPGLL